MTFIAKEKIIKYTVTDIQITGVPITYRTIYSFNFLYLCLGLRIRVRSTPHSVQCSTPITL